jgi:uncharacterized membrane protein
MISQEHDSITLMQQPANRSVVDVLYRHGYIDQQARDYVLELLYPHQRWGYWIAQVMAILGCTFILVGMIYYFAFNWQAMSSSYKFICIELGILCCVMGAWTYTLSKLSGQLFLIGACILVGAFLAVFGQVYQTGADSYELFLAWSLLILPWVLIGQLAALWMIWLILVNITLCLFWWQFVSPSLTKVYYLSVILLLLNSFFLIVRECLFKNNTIWLQHSWHRIILVSMLLTLSLIPALQQILSSDFSNTSLLISAILGACITLLMMFYFRYKQPDMWSLSLTILSICIMLLTIFYQFIDKMHFSNVIDWLLMAIITLSIFTLGAYFLKKSSFSIIDNKDITT